MASAHMPASIKLCKNPYHLYLETMFQKFEQDDQGELAEEIKFGEGPFSKVLQHDYVDLGSAGEDRKKLNLGIMRINEVLSKRFGKRDLDIRTSAGRDFIERELNEYRYPDETHLDAHPAFQMLRGVWQLLSPSARYEHLISGKPTVRLSYLIFHGFVPLRAKNKKHIDLLWMGRTTLWRARAFVEQGQDILYVDAKELRTDEHRFFSFYAPGLHDPKRCEMITKMHGVTAGTVVDPAYQHYPVSAAMCVARKLRDWSAWFQSNDNFVDDKFLADMRQIIEPNYFSVAELMKRSRESSAEAQGSDNRASESFTGIADMVDAIYSERGVAQQIVFPATKP